MSIRYTKREEQLNTWSHAGGILMGVVFGIIFLVWCFRQDNNWARVGVGLYLFGMLGSYVASTVYHALPRRSAWKERLRRWDHAAIYWHIAGSYSPLTLVALREQGYWGWSLFTFVWLCAIAGTVVSFVRLKEHSNLETCCFVGMGLSVLVAFKPLIDSVSTAAVVWIVAEGVCYITGALFYSLNKRRYMHSVFHFFVLAGSLCHIIAVWDVLMDYLGEAEEPVYQVELMNSMTPVKDQGKSQTCWVYAMLAAIETEHIMRGDSVNLSAAYIINKVKTDRRAPASLRGMGATLLSLIQEYGVVGYDAMRTTDTPEPRWVFLYGMQYTPLEFAHSVCAPGEYVALTSTGRRPYGEEIVGDWPDNWLHNRFLNVPVDTLLARTEQAVRNGHGVCWESKAHAMAVVGLARDVQGRRFFVMKNLWGTRRPHRGLDYLSYTDFRRKTLSVCMTREAFQGR